MRLGSSIRRRRSGGRKKAPAKGSPPRKRWTAWLGGLSRWMPAFSPGLLGLLGMVGILGLAGGYFFSTRLVFPEPPPPGDLSAVPDLSGEFPELAADTLEALGLVLGTIDSLRHPSAPAGTIVGQSPLPGQLSLAGDPVWIAVSTGPEERPVPDVLDLVGERARIVLEAGGFTVVEDSVQSETPRGTVVAIAPEPGTVEMVPAEVTLMVSTGPPLFQMPSLLGLDEERAMEVLDSLGLTVEEVEIRFHFGQDQGLVFEQDPPPTSMVQQGSAVRLVVGRRGT